MALLECPECGKEISSTSEKCIHCGAKFTLCPDCGKLYVGGGECPNCPSQSSAEPPKPLVNPYKCWKNEHPKYKFFVENFKRFSNIPFYILLAAVAIGLIIYFVWNGKSLPTKIAKYSSTSAILTVLCVVSGVGISFEAIRFLFQLLIHSSMRSYLVRTNTDAVAYLRAKRVTLKAIEKENIFHEYRLLTHCAYELEEPKGKNRFKLVLIFPFILAIIGTFAFIIIFPIALREKMQEAIGLQPSSALAMPVWGQAIFVILLLAFCIFAIVVMIMGFKDGKRRNAWLKQKFESGL